ncbi:uncharacterized protein LOC111288514 [Durio zibethinus]|uniref:Uncharacterized protein LOC111288514 n=1 Tax=Durio zibethinus TaxID=66656 RepID=A0A6P5Y3Z9_DURZI|nr:uncharacterized protein LOC111288514 [Durio zibethinus]
MVLGLRTKNKKGNSFQVDYIVFVKEINPWTPLYSSLSSRSVLLQWENGDQSSGSLTSSIGNGKIEFSKSFSLPVTLCQEASRKSINRDSFQKNCLEFYLYEPRKDMVAKGQVLGSAVVNLADYGIIKETINIITPINLKKSSRNREQPVLYLNIQPFDKDSSSSSPKGSLSKEVSLDKDGGESVSDSINEAKDEETEIPSFTADDDLFSYSFQTISSSVFDPPRESHSQHDKNGSESANSFSNGKVELESKIEMLEEELREAAVVEASLYSVVAEHGSSTNKVHAPARRLSRFYLHACKASTQDKRASAARAAVSGLVLVSKACGSDVPRLTFWLSNSIVLRAIVSHAIEEMQLFSGLCLNFSCGGIMLEDTSPQDKEESNSTESFDDWVDPQTFLLALEKFEAWIFSRIIESVWWQTLTPRMQSAAAKSSNSRKSLTRRYGLGVQEQGNFSVELWKKAFKDICDRLCPIRACGHECGCLVVLAKLVMEQLVGRLDVAMFNAILHESAEEMPTDSVSDPIRDSKVLPIPAGKSSFGAGLQLKNAIGNWSRWLTDLFGIDDNGGVEDSNEVGDNKNGECEASFKAFHLLNELSDLMMLPSEMLADRSTRKEVCPTFSAPLISRVLNNFVPDEFNPNPVSNAVFEALNESVSEAGEESITNFPCMAASIVYSPPSAASLTSIIREVGSEALQWSRSSVLRKSYTSDDELDELDSPINSVIIDTSRDSPTSKAPYWMRMGKGGRKVVRYQLLREICKDGE